VVSAAGFANDREFLGQIDRCVGIPSLREIIRLFQLERIDDAVECGVVITPTAGDLNPARVLSESGRRQGQQRASHKRRKS